MTDRWDGDGSVTAPTATADLSTMKPAASGRSAGCLGVDPTDPTTDYRAHDVGIDGGAASAEEAAMHVMDDEDTIAGERWRLVKSPFRSAPLIGNVGFGLTAHGDLKLAGSFLTRVVEAAG